MLLGLLLVAGACSRDVATTVDLEGSWILDAIEVDGVPYEMTVGVTTEEVPWLEIGERISGSLGCNDFQSESFVVADGVLLLFEVVRTAMLCGPEGTDVMAVENILTGALTRSESIAVTVVGSGADRVMTWTEGATRLVYLSGLPPVPPPPPPPTAVGPLDCAPGTVAELRVGDLGMTPARVLRDLVPGVVEVTPGDPLWWWGRDAAGTVIAAIAQGDIEPVQYQVFSCAR
jgi:heat shock protein HslJ